MPPRFWPPIWACKSPWSISNRGWAASACCAAASPRRPCCTWPRPSPKPSTSAEWGVAFPEPTIDLAAVRARKEKVIATLTGGLKQLAAKRKVNVVRARATFEDSQTLKLEPVDGKPLADDRIAFEHCIVATGSSPTRIPAFDLPTHRVMDSTGALELPDVPESLLVVGGGYIGLEMGTVYAALGSKVSVVEMTDGLLPGADRDLVRPLQKRLQGHVRGASISTRRSPRWPTRTTRSR